MAKPRVKVTINKSALEKAIRQGVDAWAAEMTRKLNALSPECTGRPVVEVKTAVASVWKQNAGDHQLPESHLTAYAEQLAAGGRVQLVRK